MDFSGGIRIVTSFRWRLIGIASGARRCRVHPVQCVAQRSPRIATHYAFFRGPRASAVSTPAR
ncbi:hypothetical protein A8H40_10430 [Burkholderia multivorans]|nr:hypothetical protein A8H40_10430 [Burkholderia multivorans]PRE27850.1 hypothetical protein C6P79_13020 [Burkholderia multivorans]PRG07889.1 hypothetical protein C6Q21_14265 [Burkholderia multivorans]PRG95577.1 hypothetical protein C6V04_08120 [Burkholderia multivorans]